MLRERKSPTPDQQPRSSVVIIERDNLTADAQYRFFEALPQPVTLGWRDGILWCTGPLSREFVREFDRGGHTLHYAQYGEWLQCPIDDFIVKEVAEAIFAMSLDQLRRIAPRLRKVYGGYEGDGLKLIEDDSNAPHEDDLWQMRSKRNRRKRAWDR